MRSAAIALLRKILGDYAVKMSYDPINPQEIATMDPRKKAILSAMF